MRDRQGCFTALLLLRRGGILCILKAEPSQTRDDGDAVQSRSRTAAGLAKRWREFALFVFFGSLNTLIAYAIYLLLLLVVSYPIAYTISYTSGIFISYCLNARFVFKERLRLGKALQYPGIYVIQYVLGMSLLYLFVEVAGMSSILAPFVIAILMIPVAYRLSRFIIKRRPVTVDP